MRSHPSTPLPTRLLTTIILSPTTIISSLTTIISSPTTIISSLTTIISSIPQTFHPLPQSFHPSTFKAAPAGLVIKQTLLVLRSALLEVSCKLSSPSRRSGASPDIVTTICKKTSKTEHAHCNGTVPSAPAPEGEGPNNETKDDVTRKLVDKDQIIGGGRTWRHWLKEPGFYKVSQFLCQGAQFRLILQCDYE